MTEPAVLRITGHLEVARRGAFVVGTIVSGTFRIGLQVTGPDGAGFIISAVEYVDHPGPPLHVLALAFAGAPGRAALQCLFPGCHAQAALIADERLGEAGWLSFHEVSLEGHGSHRIKQRLCHIVEVLPVLEAPFIWP